MDLEGYSPDHIRSFLLNYELFVRDLVEVAGDWPALDDDERGHYRSELMQVWGNRKVLGTLYRAGHLTPAQEDRLAEIDRLLLQRTNLMDQCFGFDLTRILTIFHWGTPLSASIQPVHIEAEPASLDRMASALVQA